MPVPAPCGSWRSPIDPGLLASAGVRLGSLAIDADDVYWVEDRPLEQGRSVLVRRTPAGEIRDVLPEGFSVRSRVHEYGGAAYVVRGGAVWFTSDADQRLWRWEPGADPHAITPEPPERRADRYADGVLTPRGEVVCVRERHREGDVVNEIVLVAGDGGGYGGSERLERSESASGSRPPGGTKREKSGTPHPDTVRVLVAGHDFCSTPRLAPDGRRLCWLVWDHPQMPWDGTELWTGELRDDATLDDVRRVAGGTDESIFQPHWSPDGRLHFVSDRTGWWNLYRDDGGRTTPLCPMEAEFGLPQWLFGYARYDFCRDGRIACVYQRDGFDYVGLLEPDGSLRTLDLDLTAVGPSIRVDRRDGVWLVAGSPTSPTAVVRVDLRTGEVETVRRSLELHVDPGYVSPPRPIEFPTTGGRTAYALHYAPRNRDYAVPESEAPPLLVVSHGGPTSATAAQLNLGIQYWTSRGFGVVDVNYGGSTGYGRAYRERLKGAWGVVDVDDCVSAARYLVARGEADPARMAVRGGSAGGYTTLCALAFRDVFTAGSSSFGIGDLEALARETHKFESRYCDGLVGPWPEARDRYRERSPLHHVDGLSCPVIFFQGLEDAVVPPGQARAMVAAMRRKAVPCAHLEFEGEQHGFRRAETIRRVAEAELSFYAQVWKLDPADEIEHVELR